MARIAQGDSDKLRGGGDRGDGEASAGDDDDGALRGLVARREWRERDRDYAGKMREAKKRDPLDVCKKLSVQ